MLSISDAFSKDVLRFDIVWKHEGRRTIDSIQYTMPSHDLITTSLDTLYEKAKSTDMTFRPERTRENFIGWPKDYLLSLIQDKSIQATLNPGDIEGIKDLHVTLTSHLEILSRARELLRQFIKERFSLEDLLHASK